MLSYGRGVYVKYYSIAFAILPGVAGGLALELKDVVNEKGWKGKVRISTSGCMGLCVKGPNVMIYPQKVWFFEVFPEDVDEIVSTIEHIMEDD